MFHLVNKKYPQNSCATEKYFVLQTLDWRSQQKAFVAIQLLFHHKIHSMTIFDFFVSIEPFIMELLSFSLQYRLTFYKKNTRSWQHKIFVAIQYFIMQWFSVLLQYTLIPYDVDFCLGSFCLALQSRIIVQFFHLLRCWVGLWFSRCVMVSCPIRCVLTCSGSMLCFEQGVVWWGRLWPLWCVVSLAQIS
jgi:hypothetical protein